MEALPTSPAQRGGTGAKGNHAGEADVSAVTTDERQHVQREAVVYVNAFVPQKNHHPCHSWVQWMFQLISLGLSIFLLVDLFLVCRDLYDYGTQPGSDSDRRQPALRWIWFFAPGLVECCAMIAALLHKVLLSLSCLTKKTSTAGESSAGERVNEPQARRAAKEAAERAKWFGTCAVLLVLSLYTAIVYIYVFNDPPYTLHHLPLHVTCVWVSFLRSLFFTFFTLTFMCY